MHDGNGLSDETSPNGVFTDPLFMPINYDLLTIGNHELYVTEVAYETFSNFSKPYGDKYLTSNVQIIDKKTGKYDYIGNKYRYFTTKHGLRIMAFGIIFDFTGNSNVSKVIKAEDLVKEQWFKDAINYEPIDLFLVTGHNPVRANVSQSTMGTIHKAIRNARPDVPIQVLGGHTHIRDFTVYDEMATGLESGRYCETLGWLSLTGIHSPHYNGSYLPHDTIHPTQKAIPHANSTSLHKPKFDIRYFRRYMDWNRLTFAYHAASSQDRTFDIPLGKTLTSDIRKQRVDTNLTHVYGCAPRTYCQSCRPYGAEGNIVTLMEKALAKTVVNETRAHIPRLILVNTGSIRFDLVQGPFTKDDSYIVSPFRDSFQFLPEIPYKEASQIRGILDSGPFQKRSLGMVDTFSTGMMSRSTFSECKNPDITSHAEARRHLMAPRTLTRRIYDSSSVIPGYTTTDDFGSDGDDTPHSRIPDYPQPNDAQANASFPSDGSMPEKVDLVFLSFIGNDYVLPALRKLGLNYTEKDIMDYMPKNFTTNSYFQQYVRQEWSANIHNCSTGPGVAGY